MTDYLTIAEPCQVEIIEKKSRFIGHAAPAETEAEARDFLRQVRQANPEASHNCYAYFCLADQIQRFSDAGEPAGTAGKPILEVIKSQNLVNVVVVVTRYFGGILLGTGGLVRAYSKAAALALNQAAKVCLVLGSTYAIRINYNHWQKAQSFFDANNCLIKDITYAEDVLCQVVIAKANTAAILAKLSELANGEINIIDLAMEAWLKQPI